ncbi:MAG TPA: SCP2 sterol-binding domain-containing protein [Nitrospirota bacterium]|nr:SCP2 sterol-binding domain-containing protein [Nitrospirota bacterium]
MNTNLDDLDNKAGQDRGGRALSTEELRKICLEEGADDAGFVEIERPALSAEREDMVRIFPGTRTVLSLVKRANRESAMSPSLPVADWEFAKVNSGLSDSACRIIRRLNEAGVRGVAIPPGFPMDITRWPGKVWEVSHKVVAEEAGVGRMGLNRIVIHPKFGNHIMLDTVLIDARLDQYDQPLGENPCIQCGLCIAVCPVGAINKDAGVDFMSCAMHNYHELFGGFQEWIEGIVSSGNVKSYRSQFRDHETMSRWQSLTYGHYYRCSYCMAVCPAGEETVEAFRADKKGYIRQCLEPLKNKKEPVYAIKGTRAEKVAAGNKAKDLRHVRNTIRPASIGSFLDGVRLFFNPEKAEGLKLTLHFAFTGSEQRSATIAIADRNVTVQEGLHGPADLLVRADAATWVRILNEEVSPVKAMLTGKLRLKGNPAYLNKFKSCLV